MARCIICGKTGLFLRVNSYGRCKTCENKCQAEAQKDLERKRIEEEKQKKIEDDKRNLARKILLNIIIKYNEMDSHCSSCENIKSLEELSEEKEKHNKMYNDFVDLLEQARNTERFREIMFEYVQERDEDAKNHSLMLFMSLSGHYEVAKIMHKSLNDQFEDAMQWLSREGLGLKLRWDERERCTKSSIKMTETQNRDISKRIIIEKENVSEQNKFLLYDTLFDTIPDCVITDIETSGLIYNKNSIIEIAAIKIVDSKVIATYSTLVHRDKTLDRKITSLTGITTRMLQECDKDINTVMKEYKDFIGDLPLVGHNINSFDIKFINEAYIKVFGRPIENQCVDTLKLSYEYFLETNSHKLGDLANYAGTPIGTAHRALGDCETTLYLYKCMMNIAASLLLKWSEKGKSVDETELAYPKYITKGYPDGMCFRHHNKLILSGYLELAPVTIALNTFKVPELKKILSDNSLQAIGSKQALIDRIAENIDEKSLNLPVIYVPSEKGKEHYEKYNNSINEMVYRHLGIVPPKNKSGE